MGTNSSGGIGCLTILVPTYRRDLDKINNINLTQIQLSNFDISLTLSCKQLSQVLPRCRRFYEPNSSQLIGSLDTEADII